MNFSQSFEENKTKLVLYKNEGLNSKTLFYWLKNKLYSLQCHKIIASDNKKDAFYIYKTIF